MFNLMREHHNKFNSLNKLKPRKTANKNKKSEVIVNCIIFTKVNTTEK